MPKQKKRPALTLHKPTGQARVRIDGRDHYLGKYGTAESREKYDDLIAEWLSRQDTSRVTLTIDDLVLLYLEHAASHYRKGGAVTSEMSCIKTALRYLIAAGGRTRARDFGPRALKDVRQQMVADGHCRLSINKHVGRIRRMFRWAVADELVKPDVLTALSAVQGLQDGRCEAVESEPVRPVPQANIDAIEPFVSRPVWGLVQMQLLTGMRPGEALMMRGCDLNMTGKVWEYTPQDHKTRHHGKRRTIFIGPKAQVVLREFLKTDLQAYIFSPRDVRTVKVECERQPGKRYNRDAYRNAIQRACRKADVPAWHPHQLRHNAGTKIRRHGGLEAAQVVLGHSKARTTEIYAERDEDTARSIVGKIG